jgi:hypothetical protein
VPQESTTREQEAVVLASFENRRAAESMVASLGRGFRKKARSGHAAAFVVSGNEDGSWKMTESRVLETGDFTAVVIRVSASWTVGFMGILSTLKGARGGVRAARKRHGHVGSGEERAHELLAEVGPDAALVLIRCEDDEARQSVAARAHERGVAAWDGPLADFLAAFDPGPQHDWVRAALGQARTSR